MIMDWKLFIQEGKFQYSEISIFKLSTDHTIIYLVWSEVTFNKHFYDKITYFDIVRYEECRIIHIISIIVYS